MITAFKGFYCKSKEIICQSALNKLWAIRMIVIFVFVPILLFSQPLPDTAVYVKALKAISQNEGLKNKSIKPVFQMIRLSSKKTEQCVSISSTTKDDVKKKLLIFWQKDSIGKWSDISYMIAASFNFIDMDNDGIQEIECINKESNRNRRDKMYRLISLKDSDQVVMFSYHQFEYYNVRYIVSNIAPDSVFAVKHTILIKDIDWDGKPEITDNIEIKYRKLPCCDHHFEYGIRQKKLVLHLLNGKFEMD